MLTIQLEDIYFLPGLSRIGGLVSLSGSRRDGEIIKDYIITHFRP